MSAKHTPGPWSVHAWPALGYVVGNVHERGAQAQVAVVNFADPSRGRNSERAKADARLIAAAPELLAHMLAIAGYADAPHVEPIKALAFIRQTALAAIAKATGEPS